MIWTRRYILVSIVMLIVVAAAVALPLTLSERPRQSPITLLTQKRQSATVQADSKTEKNPRQTKTVDRKPSLRHLIENEKLAVGTIVTYDNQFAFRPAKVGDQFLLDDGAPLLWKNVPVTYAGRESDSISVTAGEKMDLPTEMGRAEQIFDNSHVVVFSAGATHCIYRTKGLNPDSSKNGISGYEKSTVEIEMKVKAWDLGRRNDTLSSQERERGLRTAFTGEPILSSDDTPFLHNGEKVRYKWVWSGTMGYITYFNSVPERGPRLRTIEERALRSLNNDLISLPDSIVLGGFKLTVEYAGPYTCVYRLDKVEN